MTDSEIYAKLTPVFQDVFDDDSIAPHGAMVADDVEEWDSLSHIRLIVAIEKVFEVRFSTAELAHLDSVDDLVRVIKSKAG